MNRTYLLDYWSNSGRVCEIC